VKIKQQTLFSDVAESSRNPSTFLDNMKLPVHRWFRYSAGFSAQWAEEIICRAKRDGGGTRVLDPFAGSATTLIAAEDAGVESYGVDSHPFISRVARAKLQRRSDPEAYRRFAESVLRDAERREGAIEEYTSLIRRCYRDEVLADLDKIRRAYEEQSDGSAASELTWLTLAGILRRVSHVGTANWQYVLPKKSKKNAAEPFAAFAEQMRTVYRDMLAAQAIDGPRTQFVQGDARTCGGVPAGFATLVITSPPYPNNYDYADATRLEMTFMGEIRGWGGLQEAVRQHLVRSCSQHVPERAVNLEEVLQDPCLAPLGRDIRQVCEELARVRLTRGGKKTYHLMVACYFLDLAKVWHALRRCCASPCKVLFVVGDSAPYGVYVPVIPWLGRLAVAAGFRDFRFEKIRDRNVKWKNRKHRVPLCEGELLATG
jgi:hypothetical protein